MARSNKEKTIDRVCLVLLPLGFLIYVLLTLAGIYGKDHEMMYVVVTEAVLFIISIVLPLLRVRDKFITPYWFIAIIEGLLYLHGSALYFGTYMWIPHWDVIAHISAGFVVTLIAFIGLLTIQSYTARIDLGKGPFFFMLFVIGFGFGNLWELLEWFVDCTFSYAYMAYSVHDTLGDVVMDLVGSGLMTLFAAVLLRRRTPQEIISKFGLHDFMTDMGKRWDRKTYPGGRSPGNGGN
ncbi:MAG: hypothetical protein LBJ20_08115 [Candidatus Methanoplasma sp.]|jgi:hypothetical protein|nr:hypothetical protein [Candidatus Methanoplasma sp.]